MSQRQIINSVLLNRSGFSWWLMYATISLFGLFWLSETYFFSQALNGSYSLSLFVRLLPDVFGDFLLQDGLLMTFHYIIIAGLFGVYLRLITYALFVKKYFSIKSFTTSIVSLFGITLGVTCLSCGALAAVLVVTFFGVGAGVALISVGNAWFFLISELLLVVSIVLALKTIERFS